MNVVALSQHLETKQYLMIMQFADIGTLENRPCEIDSNWYIALSYAIKLASRLTSLHEMGISHKDLHSGNVVFHTDKTALLIDVGLSRGVEDAHSEDGVYGRPGYLPPEIFENKDYTQKSDVYCLGTLFWQLIVGVPPQGVASVAVKCNLGGLREELIPGAPMAFNNIIRSCWHPDPDQRPSAREVYNQLIECAIGLANLSCAMPPNLETKVLCALAIDPVPFSYKTQLFINARRINHQKRLETIKSNEFDIDSTSLVSINTSSMSIKHGKSQFYTCTQLKQITEEHTRVALDTLGQQPDTGK